MIDLSGRRILVTGGSRGNGEGIARVLSAAGAHVVVADVLDDPGEIVAASIRQDGGSAEYTHLDVRDEGAIVALCRDAALDGLVNNAGILTRHPLFEMKTEDFDLLLQINLRGYFLCAREVARQMVAAGKAGSIVNVCSTNAHHGTPTLVHYAASKGGILAMTRALAVELAEYNIRANTVSPGVIPTGLNSDRLADPEQVELSIAATALKRLGTPADLGHAAAFLLSDASSWITGTDLLLDGGELAG